MNENNTHCHSLKEIVTKAVYLISVILVATSTVKSHGAQKKASTAYQYCLSNTDNSMHPRQGRGMWDWNTRDTPSQERKCLGSPCSSECEEKRKADRTLVGWSILLPAVLLLPCIYFILTEIKEKGPQDNGNQLGAENQQPLIHENPQEATQALMT